MHRIPTLKKGLRTVSSSSEPSLPDDPDLTSWLRSLKRAFQSWYVLDSFTPKTRFPIKILLITMKVLCLTRTVFLVLSSHLPTGVLLWTGDDLHSLGITMRSMVLFVCLSFGFIILMFELLILASEFAKEESFIRDTFVLDKTTRRLFFSISEEKELHQWAQASRLISDVLFYTAAVTMPSMIAYSAFIELSRSSSLLRILLILVWAPASVFWIIRESKIYLILMSSVVMDMKLIQMRLKSLNRRFFADARLSVNEYVREFLAVRDTIQAHNKYVRWILMMIDLVSAPGNCANLYSAMAADGLLILRLMNASYSILLLIATLFMIFLPGKIYREVLLAYPRLMTMQIHSRERCLSLTEQRKILLLTEAITTAEGEIGFTNGLLATFKSSTLFEYLLSLPTACMLFYSFVTA